MARLHHSILIAAAVLFAFPAAGLSAVLECGILPYTEAAVNPRSQSTASRAFVDVVGSQVRFTTTQTTCIVVQFSAEVLAETAGSVMQVRAVRNDGKEDVVNAGGPVQFVAGPVADGRSYGLLLPAVRPGTHTVRMQFRALGDGSVRTIKSFNMNVSRGR
jgi:hypothetical protein